MTPPTSTEFFTLSELTGGEPDSAPAPVRHALENLMLWVLDPWRRRIGRLRVNSAWRTPEQNAAAGGEPSSQHLTGEAADVKPLDATLDAAWTALRGLPVDQAIRYPTHIHVSHGPRGRKHYYRRGGEGEKKYVRIAAP